MSVVTATSDAAPPQQPLKARVAGATAALHWGVERSGLLWKNVSDQALCVALHPTEQSKCWSRLPFRQSVLQSRRDYVLLFYS